MIVLIGYENNPHKFSTGLNFFREKRFFHIVNIPIIVINPVAFFRGDFVAKAFLVARFI